MSGRPKGRLDRLLVERGLAESRHRAQGLILAGRVFVAGHRVDKPGSQVRDDVEITVQEGKVWASRGAGKLLGAIEALPWLSDAITGADCLDVGASTGGFTDVLLEHGAARVIALDVGYGQLHWRLQQDARVTVLDRTNIRLLTPDSLPFSPTFVTCDTSFISITAFLDVIARELATEGLFVALVKPQFEVGRERLGKGGVVRDEGDRQFALDKVRDAALANGFTVKGVTDSPIHGHKGNREFLLVLQKRA